VQASSASPCGVGGRRRARAGVWGTWGGAGQHGGAYRALDVVDHSTISTDTRTTSVASPAYFKCEYGLSK
jgi:hypothetical protein